MTQEPSSVIHPGELLKTRYLDPLGISVSALARAISKPEGELHALIEGLRGIDVELAKRLGAFFCVPARWWLQMQMDYELAVVAEPQDVEVFEQLNRAFITPKGARWLNGSAVIPQGALMIQGSKELIDRLRARAPDETPRQLVTVTYENGAIALVGSS